MYSLVFYSGHLQQVTVKAFFSSYFQIYMSLLRSGPSKQMRLGGTHGCVPPSPFQARVMETELIFSISEIYWKQNVTVDIFQRKQRIIRCNFSVCLVRGVVGRIRRNQKRVPVSQCVFHSWIPFVHVVGTRKRSSPPSPNPEAGTWRGRR